MCTKITRYTRCVRKPRRLNKRIASIPLAGNLYSEFMVCSHPGERCATSQHRAAQPIGAAERSRTPVSRWRAPIRVGTRASSRLPGWSSSRRGRGKTTYQSESAFEWSWISNLEHHSGRSVTLLTSHVGSSCTTTFCRR